MKLIMEEEIYYLIKTKKKNYDKTYSLFRDESLILN